MCNQKNKLRYNQLPRNPKLNRAGKQELKKTKQNIKIIDHNHEILIKEHFNNSTIFHYQESFVQWEAFMDVKRLQ